ncbi:AAEL012188-PA [Aedes aegypti]|uniref:AAEL012188-PA n=1 Tax=Aedes aegypti TaxID=7159 RepID=Q16MU5_AEDAE|nr:AAEL012188-PA [Aedes aegypti]
MPLSSAVHSVPHVFEKIFTQLNLQDRLTAAAVCRDWETAIFNTRSLADSTVLRIVCEDPDLLDVTAEVHQSRRKYRNVAVLLSSPLCKETWIRLIELLKILNQKCAVEWFWCSTTQEQEHSDWVDRIGEHNSGTCKELELTITVRSSSSSSQSLTMHDAHCEALVSVQRHCRKLRHLALSGFGLTKLLAEVLDFPCLESLTIEELLVPKNIVYQYRHGYAVLPQLKSFSLTAKDIPTPSRGALELATRRLPMTVIFAPQLETVRLSYLLRHFFNVKIEQPRFVNVQRRELTVDFKGCLEVLDKSPKRS